MKTEFKYGADATLSLEFPDGTQLIECLAPRGGSLAEPGNAVLEAFDSPLDLPPLSAAVLPSDVVAVAVEEGLPQAAEVAAGVARAVLACGVRAESISVLLANSDAALASAISELVGEAPIEVVVHDPHDRRHLAYLAVSRDDRPIYMNRRLCDADVVLPLTQLQITPAEERPDIFRSFFPAFTDDETQSRLRQAGDAASVEAVSPAEEAAELLGVLFATAIVPGEKGGILRVMTGASRSIQEQGRKICQDAWTWEIPQRSSLVVGALSGGAESQTWENFGRVLRTAASLVESGGAIVVCSELAAPPTDDLTWLAAGEETAAIRRELEQQQNAEAAVSLLLADILEEHHVYLLSALAPDFVEALGMTPVQNAGEISRLSSHFESCILLANAQHIFPKLMQP